MFSKPIGSCERTSRATGSESDAMPLMSIFISYIAETQNDHAQRFQAGKHLKTLTDAEARRNGVERTCEFFLALRTVISLAGISHLTPETVQV